MNRIVPVLLSRRTPTVPAVVLLTVLVTVVGVVGTAPAAAAVRPDPPGTALPTLVDAPAPAGGAVWPLRPRPEVVSGFDPPSTRWGAGHRGVDLAGSVAAPVRTALPGVVTFAGRIAGRGVVVVSHGDTRTTYEPVRDAVDVGDRVAAGERIGTLELFGSHCFPRACLHWGLIEGGLIEGGPIESERYLDPLSLVGAAPVRLLPWDGLVRRAASQTTQTDVVPAHADLLSAHGTQAFWTGGMPNVR